MEEREQDALGVVTTADVVSLESQIVEVGLEVAATSGLLDRYEAALDALRKPRRVETARNAAEMMRRQGWRLVA